MENQYLFNSSCNKGKYLWGPANGKKNELHDLKVDVKLYIEH